MTDERRIEVEAEIATTPEQAWEAIATGPGITAWFMPADVEGRVGGRVVHRHDGETESPGTVTAYDPPHRFAYVESPDGDEPFAVGGEARPLASEFLVEARSGGTCVVRIVMSGFGDGEAWDRAIESFVAGWREALVSLRLYLERFPGQPVASVNASETTTGDREAIWRRLVADLGLPAAPRVGDRVATGEGCPRLAGTVESADGSMLTLVLDEPAPGLGFVAVGGPGDDVFAFVRAQLFGERAAETAARQQPRWDAWFADRALAR